MWQELGISGGTAVVILVALYFIVKWAVKNGVTEAYRDNIRKDLKKIHGYTNRSRRSREHRRPY